MEKQLIGLAKTCIKSVFTVEKYGKDILFEDLDRIVFIRNLIEESVTYIKESYKEMNVGIYNEELKEYSLELYIKQCIEEISEEKKDKDFDIKEEEEEIRTFFNYIYSNLEYPE